ncbi:MAG: hypothetical protein FI729_03020 [SAR202 cluster bacterium]|nr:hypothetical protein [SAR202 cluster bacterium]
MDSKNGRNLSIACMLLIICLISAIDLFLAIKLIDPSNELTLRLTEKNPVIVKMALITGDWSVVIPCKIFGTLLSVMTIIMIYRKNKRKGFFVCLGVFMFQILLLLYLVFG